MASHDVKTIKQSALLLGNDLLTGKTVYLTEEGRWTTEVDQAWKLTNDTMADRAMKYAAEAESNNEIIGGYLVDATSAGEPTHIRERLRVNGPSVNFLQNQL